VPDAPSLSFRLDDGTPVVLRPVGPEDRERIRHGFEELSEASRRYRFLAPLAHLSEAQLDYLTEVDQMNHVAWGAPGDEKEAHGLGVARFIRLPGEPDTAEFAVTVVDEAQGHGLGTLLMALLYVLAARRGVRTLRGVVARDNTRMVEWLLRLGAHTVPGEDDLTMDLPVSDDPSALPDNPSAVRFRARLEEVQAALGAAGDRR